MSRLRLSRDLREPIMCSVVQHSVVVVAKMTTLNLGSRLQLPYLCVSCFQQESQHVQLDNPRKLCKRCIISKASQLCWSTNSRPLIALFQSISYICFLDMPRFSTFAPFGPALHKEMSIMLAEQGKTRIEKGFRSSRELIWIDDFTSPTQQTQDECTIRFIWDA